MRELLAYLHDPELVARFQRLCGLFLVEPAHRGRAREPTGTGREEGPAQLRAKAKQQDQNSNVTHEANGYAANVSRFEDKSALGVRGRALSATNSNSSPPRTPTVK